MSKPRTKSSDSEGKIKRSAPPSLEPYDGAVRLRCVDNTCDYATLWYAKPGDIFVSGYCPRCGKALRGERVIKDEKQTV